MHAGTYGIWKRLPFARMLIFFFIGILIDRALPIPFALYCSALLILLILICIIEYLPLRYQWRLKQLHGLLIILLILFVGSLNNNITPQRTEVAIKTSKIDSSSYLLIKINDQSHTTNKTVRYQGTLLIPQEHSYTYAGKCFVYVQRTSAHRLEKKDLIITLEKPQRVINTSNPGSFDFSAYAKQQQVTHTLFIKDDHCYIRLRSDSSKNNSIIEDIRQKILFILRTSIKDTTHVGLAEAMLIGYREDLDRTLLNNYIATGVVHVIAISGLHLGLIFMLIDLGIKSIFGKKRAAVAGVLITIPLLWGFAILTGSSSSVNRSALMFTVLILGRLISKRNNSLNVLCASAFILLFYNPSLITDLGFQLSYVAVGSILLFERGINTLIYLKNKIAKYVWNMVSITLAAQILTTPLVILHFHRFPTLFLFSNLVAVPLSSIILILEIALCIVYLLGIDVVLIVDLIELLMKCMNGYIEAIGKISFNMIDNIYVSDLYMIICCLLIGSLIWLIGNASRKTYWITSILFLLLGIVRFSECLTLSREKKIIVLNLKKNTAIVVQHGENGMLAVSKYLAGDISTIRKMMKEIGNATGIDTWETRYLPDRPCMLSFSMHKSVERTRRSSEKVTVISGNPGLSLAEMGIPSEKAEKIVADGSNTLWKIRQWEKEAYGLHLPLHTTAENGPITFRID